MNYCGYYFFCYILLEECNTMRIRCMSTCKRPTCGAIAFSNCRMELVFNRNVSLLLHCRIGIPLKVMLGNKYTSLRLGMLKGGADRFTPRDMPGAISIFLAAI